MSGERPENDIKPSKGQTCNSVFTLLNFHGPELSQTSREAYKYSLTVCRTVKGKVFYFVAKDLPALPHERGITCNSEGEYGKAVRGKKC